MASSQITEEKIYFTHQGETYQTYYKRFGDLENRTRNPLVVLHGGSGSCHSYMVPFFQLTEKYGVPVVLYDQLGNAKSRHLKEKSPTFWTIDLFIDDELVNLLNHFNIQDVSTSLVILGVEYSLQNSKFAGSLQDWSTWSLLASSHWNQSNGQLMQAFSEEVKQGLLGGMKEPEKFFLFVLFAPFHRNIGVYVHLGSSVWPRWRS